MTHDRVLLDSDAFVGWLTASDAHHAKVVYLIERIRAQHLQPVTTNLVVAETATLLSVRQGQNQARHFLSLAQSVYTIVLTETLHQATMQLFSAQQRAHTSFVDMANVVVMEALEIPWILSFDATYRKHFGLKSFEAVPDLLRQ